MARFPGSRRARVAASAVLLLGSALVYGAARDRAFVARPYLVCPDAGSVTIRGFTRHPTRWTVVPLTIGSPHGEEPAPTRSHEVVLTRLPQDRIVEVQVRDENGPVEGGHLRFRTDPGPSPNVFEFAVVGDSGGAPNRLLELFGATPHEGAKRRPSVITRRMSATRPQLVLHAGDVVYPYGGREDYARAFFRPFEALLATAPIAAAIGNHDLKTDDGSPFLDVLGSRECPPLSEGKYRSFDYGPLHVALLDSTVEGADGLERQVRWLANDLRNARRPWKIAVCHVPLWFANAERWEQIGPVQRAVSERLRQVCETGGVSLVFAGHHHWYERSKPLRGMVQIVTGGGGDDVDAYLPGDFARAETYFHFVHCRIVGDVLTLRAIRGNGDELEPEGVTIFRRR